jgi:tetratricopeptide (TPR) repeat protein
MVLRNRPRVGVSLVLRLRLADRAEGSGHVVDMLLDGGGPQRSASVRFGFELTARDREDLRWYLEDYLQYPVDPAPEIAHGVEARLAALGEVLFGQVFRASMETAELWLAVRESLADARVEVATGVAAAAGIPWELLRDPATGGALAVRAGAFVRALAESATRVALPPAAETLRVLLVICRPGGRADVPFRSVASHLVRLSSEAREAFQLDVLRPPTFAQLARVLQAAKVAGSPYHVVHFDGHGAWLEDDAVAAGSAGGFDQQRFSVLSPARPGSHGYLVFEDPSVKENQQLVDGPALGQLMVDGGVPVLVLNACRSAHAGLATEPERGAGLDAHGRVRAYGSLAQEVMDAGVVGVVAMAYNVYVVTAAQFIGEVYVGLLAGRELGQAVTSARRQLAASPLRQISLEPRPLQDWLVPVVFEAAPLALRAAPQAEPDMVISLSQQEAGQERAGLDPAQLGEPDVGFYGRDETLLALDRAFDTAQIVLLHAWAGAGKTTTALEFARWYGLTGAIHGVLFTSFTRHLPLARLLDQIGDQFGPALAQAELDWATLDDDQRRELALSLLAQVKVLWVWDNVEPIAGFPAGTPSVWSQSEQDELAGFMRDLARRRTGCKVLLTSRRDEHAWLGDLTSRVALPPMPMLERLELAKAVASRQTGTGQRFLEVEDWRPLLEFTQGNPLTVTVLTRQALREHRSTREQIETFVADLRSGAASVTDDARQGRGASLAASLDYGFEHAFTDTERAQLAILALFQGFIDVDALTVMGNSDIAGGPVAALAGLTREHGIALLNRAAETGLLTSNGSGYYAVHPAVPWHLRRLFEDHYGPAGSPAVQNAIRSWTAAISGLGDYWSEQYSQGHSDVVAIVAREEDNMLRARQLARQNGWWDQVIGPMQGLRVLYEHTGRTIEWQRLVIELTPDLTNPDTNGPLLGRDEQWAMHTPYRVRIARQGLDWPTAEKLQEAVIAWRRQEAADIFAADPYVHDGDQRNIIYNLAVSVGDLAQILREQDKSSCVASYHESMDLFHRIGNRQGQATSAYNLGLCYEEVPDLYDLDQAEYWYERELEFRETHETRGIAQTTAQLGSVAYRRFLDSQRAGEPAEQLARHLTNAANAYEQALRLFSADDVASLGVSHHQLGVIYGETRDTDRALQHYRQAIHYEEQQDNRYSAGQSRFSAAIDLRAVGRNREALLYVRAALRDFDATGAGAATVAGRVRQLIAVLEQEVANEP